MKLTSKYGVLRNHDDEVSYPRPSLVRSSFQSLNGLWHYRHLAASNAVKSEGMINVPFSIETALSGVETPFLSDDTLVYTKTFIVDKHLKAKNILLHFLFVDYQATVKLNGHPLGFHQGGYDPFFFNLTPLLVKGENTLEVIVKDPSDHGLQERGKQMLKRQGMWYTPTSGIYGDVFLEAVEDNYLRDYYVTSDIHQSTVTFHLDNSLQPLAYQLKIFDGERLIHKCELTNTETTLTIANLKLWTIDDPHLYTFTLTSKTDAITGYFGHRQVSIGPGHQNRPVVYLNDQPIFINGLLDQGYWPESGLTPPSHHALINDIQLAKSYGFNCLRKHIKIEHPAFYYHCDRLGMLVIQDMPNGGIYSFNLMSLQPNLGIFKKNDHKYKAFGRSDHANRLAFIDLLDKSVARLRKHPSIIIWGPFNEGWGQFDAKSVTEHLRQLDTTRLIDATSGWFDQKCGDFNSLHNYFKKLKMPANDGRIAFLSEFGGYSLSLPSHRFNDDKEYGYKKFKTVDQLAVAFLELYQHQVFPLFLNGLAGVIYTQLSDVEDETNGIVTYDRAVNKLPMSSTYQLLSRLKY